MKKIIGWVAIIGFSILIISMIGFFCGIESFKYLFMIVFNILGGIGLSGIVVSAIFFIYDDLNKNGNEH